MELIRLNNVLPMVFSGRTDVVSDVWKQDIEFRKGEIYLVEAASGTGKSSMCSYIIGYRNDYEGKITFDDNDISQFSVSKWTEIRKNSLSHLFQELRLFPELTAYDNIVIKNQLTNHFSHEQIIHYFHELGIQDKVNSRICQMSFGQQQRVAMIRALAQPFDFILVDEPVSHLDETNSEIMGRIMVEEAQRQGAGIIVTSIGKHMNLPYQHTFRL